MEYLKVFLEQYSCGLPRFKTYTCVNIKQSDIEKKPVYIEYVNKFAGANVI